MSRANLLRARRDHTAAIAACQEALELDPAYPWAHVLLGDLYAETGRVEEARQHLQRAAAVQPGNPNIKQKLERLRGPHERRPAGHPTSAHTAASEVVAGPPGEAESLRLAYSLKEKAEKLLASLEELRATEELSDDEYGTMRKRYLDAVARATSQVDSLKAALGRRRGDHEQEAERESRALDQLQADAGARQLLDYQVADRRASIERRLAAARAQTEEIARALAAESAEDLGGFVDVDLETGQPQAAVVPRPAAPMPGSRAAAGLCSSCGATIMPGTRFCDQCGASLPSVLPAAPTSDASQPSNTSGLGSAHSAPEEAKRWNWGAFFIGLFWAPAHKLWGWFAVLLVLNLLINLLASFPPIMLVAGLIELLVSIYLGLRGGRLAWSRRRFDGVEHFCQVQRIWGWVGLVYFVIAMGSLLVWGLVALA